LNHTYINATINVFCIFLLLVMITFYNLSIKKHRQWKKMMEQVNQKAESERNKSLNSVTFLQKCFDHIDEGILVVDCREEIIYYNKSIEEILDFKVSLERTPFWSVLRNQDLIKQAKEALNGKNQFFGEFVFPSPNEKNITYQICTISNDYKSEEKRALIVLSDTTKIRKLERIRTDFVSNVSHELKSPLGAILGYVETLLDDPSISDKNRKKFTEVIHKNIIKLIAIVEDLLILSRVETGGINDISKFYPEDIIREVVELYEGKINAKHLELKIIMPSNHLAMVASKFQIRQVILNLLDNAIKYTNNHGSITITLSMVDESIVFSFSDTGIGIPYHEQERIYERFYQVEKSRTVDLNGTGLGLSIIKHIVDLHKGHIDLDSRLNHGSTFTVFFPQNLTKS